ncbi:MAG: hypothetical protein O7B35_02490 [Deltaproteobacteria bacterium]|nr:hypothetical protein [Deltaproteobacteria bacterium]
MSSFAKGRLDAELFSDYRRRHSADREIEEIRRSSFVLTGS